MAGKKQPSQAQKVKAELSSDPLKHGITRNEVGEEFTSFVLAEGTKLQLGTETVELATDTDRLFIRGVRSRDAIVDLLVSTGNAATNAHLLPYTEKRDDKTVSVTYGGRGQREETVVTEAE
jgi:hypothetical protein